MTADRRVENMVCPLCASMHGKPHKDGCPAALSQHNGEYTQGWIAARDALLPPLCDEILRLRETANGR